MRLVQAGPQIISAEGEVAPKNFRGMERFLDISQKMLIYKFIQDWY
jgi:hypothetical protein